MDEIKKQKLNDDILDYLSKYRHTNTGSRIRMVDKILAVMGLVRKSKVMLRDEEGRKESGYWKLELMKEMLQICKHIALSVSIIDKGKTF